MRAGEDDDGRRVDRVLRKFLPGVPLSALHRLLRVGAVKIDGRKVAPSDRIAAGSTLTLPDIQQVDTPKVQAPPSPRTSVFQPLFENDLLLVADKRAGMLTHGTASLEQVVAEYLRGRLPASLSFRPGPLHRLDRRTSGIIVFSKSIDGARLFSTALASRRIRKTYLAIIDGHLPGQAHWEDRLERDAEAKTSRVVRPEIAADAEAVAGAVALTGASPLAHGEKTTLVLLTIETGRTHQIRAQAASRGFPLSGDVKYGGSRLNGGFLLHAYRLECPDSALLPPLLIAPPPPRFLRETETRFGAHWARLLSQRNAILI